MRRKQFMAACRWAANPLSTALWLACLLAMSGQVVLAQAPAGLVAFEAEDGEPTAPARVVEQRGRGISGVGFAEIVGRGRMAYRVNLPADGNYAVWVCVSWPTNGSDSLDLVWQDQPAQSLVAGAKRDTWSWVKAPQPVTGRRGPQSLVLTGGERPCQIDKVMLTTDLSARVYRADTTQNALLEADGRPHVTWQARAVYQAAMKGKQTATPAETKAKLESAVSFHHDYLEGLYALAWVQAKTNEPAAAAVSFLRVLALQPSGTQAVEAEAGLGRLKERLGPTILVFSPEYAAAQTLASQYGFTALGRAEAEQRWQGVTGQPIASHVGSSLVLGEFRIEGVGDTGEDVLRVTRPATGDQEVAKLLLPTPGASSVHVFGKLLATPQGECLAVTAHELLVFRPEAIASPRRKARPDAAQHSSLVGLSPDATRIVVAGQQLESYDFATLERQWVVTTVGEVPSGGLGRSYALTVSPDGRFVATAGHFGPAQIFDLATGRLLRTFAPRTEADKVFRGALGLNRDGSRLWWYRDQGWLPNSGKEEQAGTVERLAVTADAPPLVTPVAGTLDCLAASRTAAVMCGHGPAGGDWRAPIEFLQAWDEATGQAVAFHEP